MSRLALSMLALSAALAALCAALLVDPSDRSPPVAVGEGVRAGVDEVFGGPERYETVRTATRFRVFLVDPTGLLFRPGAELKEYDVIEGPTTISPELGSQLVDILLSEGTYDFAEDKDAFRMPNVRVELGNGESRLNLLFCFESNSLKVFYDGKLVGGEDIDPGRPELVRLMRKFFPDDPLFAQLPEAECGLGGYPWGPAKWLPLEEQSD